MWFGATARLPSIPHKLLRTPTFGETAHREFLLWPRLNLQPIQ
jgi:hypothetical protein